MKKLLTSDKVYIGKSRIIKSERGVYAARNIKKDELIEKCPIIEVPRHDLASLNESILATYFFYFGEKKEQLLIALGFGSIYNHSYEPNAKYKVKQKEQTVDFIALRDIKKDEEIAFNYIQGDPTNKNPLWFNA